MNSGWAPDPAGRHQQRWWDGSAWTAHVLDGGEVTVDDTVATAAAGSSASVEQNPGDPVTGAAGGPLPSGDASMDTPPPPARRRASAGPSPFGVIRPGTAHGGSGSPSAPTTRPASSVNPPVARPPGAPPVGGDPGAPMVPVVSNERSNAPMPAPPLAGPPAGASPGTAAGLSVLSANSIVSGLVAGVIGGSIGTFLSNLQGDPSVTSQGELNTYSGVSFMLVGIALGAVLAGWDAVTSGAWERAFRLVAIGGVVGAVAGFAGGYLAQALYSSMLADIDYYSSSAEDSMLFARAVGWGLFGLILGGGLGLPFGGRKVINGVIGGLVGGAVAGAVFQQLAGSDAGSETEIQWLGHTITGVAIGVVVGIVDRIRRQTWIQLTAGPLAGREVILHRDRLTLGSSPNSDVVVANDPTAAPVHVILEVRGHEVVLQPQGAVTVNGATFPTAGAVRAGSQVGFGRSTFVVNQRQAPT